VIIQSKSMESQPWLQAKTHICEVSRENISWGAGRLNLYARRKKEFF
jgi:hypothetical protein